MRNVLLKKFADNNQILRLFRIKFQSDILIRILITYWILKKKFRMKIKFGVYLWEHVKHYGVQETYTGKKVWALQW